MTDEGAIGVAGLCLALTAILPAAALAETPQGQPHVHGKANLSLVIEETALTIEFTAPLHDLAGFEHEPKDAADRKALAQLREKLKTPQAVVNLPASAGCGTRSATIEGLGSNDHPHDRDDDDHPEREDHGHTDVIATYALTCSALKSVSTVDVTVLTTFPTIISVEVTVLGPSMQFARKLTGANTLLRLR